MNKKHSRIPKFLALVLAVMLLIGSFPVAALDAAEEVPASENDTQAVDETQAPDVADDVEPEQPAAEPEDEVEPAVEKPTEELAPVGEDPVTYSDFVAVIYCEAAGTDDASRNFNKAFDSNGELTYDFPGEAYVFVRNTKNGVQYFTNGWTNWENPVTLLNEKDIDPSNPDKLGVPKGKNKIKLSAAEGDTFTLKHEAIEDSEDPAEDPTEAPFVLPDGFYLIRPNWTLADIDSAEKLSENKVDSDWSVKASLSDGDKIKVVKVMDNKIETWYPDGYGNEYVVDADHAGNKEVLFDETYNDVWGGYIYIDQDNDVAADETKPALTLVEYRKNGQKWEDTSEWLNKNDKVSVVLQATDAEPSWGIDPASFAVNGNKVNASSSGDKYTIDLVKKESVNITVKDKAHNTSDPFKTDELKVDKKAPTASDISCKFTKKDSIINQILKTLSFGVYSDDTTVLEVTVDPNGGSSIESLVLKDGDVVLEPSKTEKADGKLIVTYELPKKNDEENKEQNKYDLAFYQVTDKVGNVSDENGINIRQTKMTVESEDVVPSSDDFDIVVTDLAPDCTASVKKSDKKYTDSDTETTYYSGAITFSATVTDFTGINQIKTYFDTSDKIQKDGDGKYDLDAYATIKHKVDGSEAAVTDFSQDTKLTSKSFTVSVPADQASGTYKLLIAAKNTVEKTSYTEVEVNIDNTAPEVVDVDFDTTWTNEPVDVSFKVTDADPSAGIKSVSVTGPDGAIASDKISFTDGAYHFDASKNGAYKITATDNLDHTSEEKTADVQCYDVVKPTITNLTYNKAAEKDYKQWSAEPVLVEFDVSDDLSGIDDATLTVVPVSPAAEKDPEKLAVTIKDGKCSFKANAETEYKINISDNATNAADEVTTAHILYDPNAPTFEKIVFRSATYRKFGLYSNKVIYADVYVKSEGWIPGEIGSDVVEITAKDNDTVLEADQEKPQADNKDDLLRYRTFILKPKSENNKTPYQLSFYTKKGNSLDLSISSLDKFGGVYVQDGETLNLIEDAYKSLFEIIVTESKPSIGGFEVVDMTTQTSDENVAYYSGSTGTLKLAFEDDFVGLDADTLKLTLENTSTGKKKDITDAAQFSGSTTIKDKTNFTGKIVSDLSSIQKDNKITKLDMSYDISKFLDNPDDILPSGQYKLTAKVKNYAGNEREESFKFWVDNTDPEVLTFDFTGDPGHKAIDTDDRDVTRYGYFYKDETTVRIIATDVIDGIKGVGIKEIYFWADSSPQLGSQSVGKKSYSGEKLIKDGNNYYVDIPMSAGFKGKLYAYAVDKFDFNSTTRSPSDNNTVADGLILENQNQHDASSGAKIDILTEPVNQDVRGNKLYNTAVNLRFMVYDSFSGIKGITYTVTDYNNKTYTGETEIDKDTDVSDADPLGFSWTITDTDKNLATELTKNITLDTGRFDCNFIKITLTAVDNCGFPITEVEENISIDTKPPVLEISYSPSKGEAQYSKNGYDYYNSNRTATITVTERNFDPADFDVTQFIAVEGTLPALVGKLNWSREYSEYLDTTKHIAEITFAEDGKFDVDFDYIDLAKNKANDIEKESFIIDKTKPVMTVTLEKNSTPRYYQSNTATIKIIEHNFDPDSAHLTYTPTATGPDYASGGTAPQIGAWSSNGDEHVATIPFNDEGKYSFKITFKDLANNQADDHNEPDFYIDHTANKPEFKDVTSRAYDGDIAPGIIYQDHSFDTNNYKYTLTRHAYNIETQEQETSTVEYPASKQINNNSSTGLASGADVKYQNFDPNDEMVDGIYTLKAEFTDLANNHAENSITFSVNRFGSVFILGSAATEELVENYYTNDAPDVVIREISAVPHSRYSATLSYNSSNKELKTGADQFKVDSPNSVGAWYEYRYTIGNTNFDNEGEYTVTVSSTYKYGNKESSVTNRTASVVGEHDRNCPVTFVVDKTAPKVVIAGVDENGYYSEAEKTLEIICTDDNLDTGSLVVEIDGQPYDVEAAMKENGEELFGEIDLDIPIVAANGESKHKITAQVKDFAKNENSDKINEFTLSATFLTMFFHNTVALIVTGAVLAALIALAVILIIKKRKNSAN